MDERGNPKDLSVSGMYTVHIEGCDNIVKLRYFLNQHIPDTHEQTMPPKEIP